MARTPNRIRRRYIVTFRTTDGSYGEIGYITFKTIEEAEGWGRSFKERTPWVGSIEVKHPAKYFSNY